MAAEFENGVFTENRPAWHGLGTTLPNESLDSREALDYSKLGNWELSKQPIYAGNADDGFTPIADHFAVTRATDHRVLGVVGSGYTIVPNEDAFDWMDTLLGGEGFHYKTAGSLRGGKIVWLLAKAPFTIDLPDSAVDMYVLLTNSHDGSGAVKALLTPTRVVCMNTLRWAMDAAHRSVSIRHTTNAAHKLGEAQRVLGLAKGAAERMETEANRLAGLKLTDKQFSNWLTKLIPLEKEEGRKRTAAQNTQAAIRAIYNTADDQLAIRGTAWGALNAVTAFSDHQTKSRTAEGGTDGETRMIRVMVKDSPRQITQRAAALFA